MKHLLALLALIVPLSSAPASADALRDTLVLIAKDAPAPTTTLGTDEQMCMAHMIYHEARGEPVVGQLAVISVVHNRVKARRWADTICGVIGWAHAFSFVDPDTLDVPVVDDTESWNLAWMLAGMVTEPLVPFEELDHYHTDGVDPYWNDVMELRVTIGAHLFYRDPTTTFAGVLTSRTNG